MLPSSRGAKMVLVALKKQGGVTEEWQIKQTSSVPSAELNTNSTTEKDPSVVSGMLISISSFSKLYPTY